MDTKDDRCNLENIPDKLWDAISADKKKSVDEDIDKKLKGDIKPIEVKIAGVNKQNDIA